MLPSSPASASSYSRVSDAEPFLSNSKKERKHLYRSLDNDEILLVDQPWPHKWFNIRSLLLWRSISLCLLSVSILSLVRLFSVQKRCSPSIFGSFESGFHTDLEAVRPFTELRIVKFTEVDGNGTNLEDQPLYVGTPNEKIDQAWEELLYGQSFDLPSELAGGMKEKTWEELQGGLYRTSLHVYHQIHCLDYIRRSMYPHYYPPEDFKLPHIEHCLDYIRQSLMCHADATPVGWTWKKDKHLLEPQLDQHHTCRNFDRLKEFTNQHAVALYQPLNQDLIDQKIAEGVL